MWARGNELPSTLAGTPKSRRKELRIAQRKFTRYSSSRAACEELRRRFRGETGENDSQGEFPYANHQPTRSEIMSSIRFDGRVVVVTGAGGGLGRTYSLDFARRGAKVVVNDIGVNIDGSGNDTRVVDAVVDEIRSDGHAALPNYDSVEDGDKIIQAAIDEFGRVDVLVNNAGIIRDKSFGKMSEDDWDMVYRVHLLGAFRTTKAAWAAMRGQGFGRIINTSSPAGVYGNFGQANYSLAKLGLYGFTRTLSKEGEKYGILVNAIAPYAASRMSASVEKFGEVKFLSGIPPEWVAALVVRLCADHSKETGSLFEVGGGIMHKLRWEQSEGLQYPIDSPVSAEDIDRDWAKLCSFETSFHFDTLEQVIERIMKNIRGEL